MALLVLAGGLVSIAQDDRLAGFGRDGVVLGELAAAPDTLRTLRADAVHRAGPALLVAVVAGDHVRRGFQIFDLACLALAAAVWGSIGRLGPRASWLGFVMLFLAFGTAKAVWAEPTTADAASLLVGMLLLRAHLARWDGWLLLGAALAAWVSPAAFAAALLLWALRPGAHDRPLDGRALAFGLAGLAFVGLVCAHPLGMLRPLRHTLPVDREALPLAIVVAVAWLYLGARWLLDGARQPQLDRVRIAVALFVYLGVEITVRLVARTPFSPIPFAAALLHAAARPGLFLVAHVAWAGPIFLVTVLRWRDVGAVIRGESPGLVACFLIILVESIDPHTRLLTWALPFVVGFTLLAVEPLLDRWIAMLLGAGAFVSSRVWFPLGLSTTPVDAAVADHTRQHYFMTVGPTMHPDGYALQGALILQGTLLLYLLLRRGKASS
jgi:hypothetical protein